MSKEARVRVGDLSCDDSSSAPYSTRREKSRKLAQKRRDTYKQIMEDLTSVLPFPKEAVSQLDYNSRLRLALCFFRLKTMMDSNGADVSATAATDAPSSPPDSGKQIVKRKVEMDRKPVMFQAGALQDLMSEALDGFLMVTQVDGTIVFLSESIHKHMGLFQSEHIGVNMFELIHEEDHGEVRSKISEAEMKSLNEKGSAKVTFFCRMKCSRYKVANVITKSPGYKLVYISGTIKRAKGEPFIACVVRPVSPPSVLEIRLEGNMFVCRYGVDFTCTYFDGRLRPLLGYDKDDLLGKKPFDLFHHEDIAAIVKCRNKVFEKGESLSGYYRFFNAHGQSIWLQTRATLIIDSRTGKPVCVNCMFFVISKEDGDRDLQMRLAIQNGESNIKEENVHSHDPIPVIERADGTSVNPLEDEKVPSPDLSPLPPTSDRGESPTSSSPVDLHGAGSTGNPSPSSSEGSVGDTLPLISSSGIGVSTSSLHSMSPVDSGTGTVPSSSLHGSSTSINSGNISSRESVFTDRSSPQEPTSTVSPRPQSVSPDKADSCLPDSTTSVHSSPLNYGGLNRTVSDDLGYRSGSTSSLRDHLVSGSYNPIFRTESNASSIVSDNPLSVCSSVHSNASGSTLPYVHTPAGMSLNPGFHSQSPFHSPENGFDSGSMMPPPTSQRQSSPLSQYNYVQQSAPIHGNGFPAQLANGSGVNVAPQPAMNLSNGVPPQQQQFAPQSFLPSNGAPGLDLSNSLPDWTPGPSAVGMSTMMSSATPLGYSSSVGCTSNPPQRGVEQAYNLQTTAGPGFGQFVVSASQMTPGRGLGEEAYNPPPIVPVGGASMFVNQSMAGHPASTTVMGPATSFNGNHALSSDLPQLTGEDLKILDAFDQFPYQQAAVMNGSALM